jgi:hypothetical protein
MQRRAESTALDWAQFGYATSDAIYAAAGKYYIEASISTPDEQLFKETSLAVRNLVTSLSAGKSEIPYLNLFPKENLKPETFKFITADAFGSELKNIFAAEYNINGNSLTAYMCKDSTGEIFNSYYKFLVDNGGTELKDDLQIPGCKAVELFGTTDVIFKAGQYFAGVRSDSAKLADLKQTASKLFNNLK